jgi:hypothetical protein
MKRFVAVTLIVLATAASASAWWDTWVRAQKSEPLVKALDAVATQGVKKAVDDKQANGGTGGKVAFVAPGESLAFEMDLKHSAYSVWLIARADDKDYVLAEAATDTKFELPGGPATIKTPRPPEYATLNVKSADGNERSWYMPIAYRDDYRIVSKLYFPLNVDGKCRISVGLDTRSKIGLLVNRIEVRDVLGECVRKALKTQRTLGAASAAGAVNRAKVYSIGRGNRMQYRLPPQELAGEERIKRSDETWAWVPDINMVNADPRFEQWHNVIGRDSKGLHVDLADIYENTSDPDAGMDAAVLLCAIAEKYPGLDHYFLDAGQYSQLASAAPLTWTQQDGKTVYSGWAGGDLSRLATSYDRLFDFIKGNQALADYVHTRIPWVKTPQDVVELLDTGILQNGIDCVNREIIRDSGARSRCLRALGVDLGKDMPAAPIFAAARALVEDPSDNRLSDRSRGDVSYIGSALYTGWGQPRGYLHLAGGFPLEIGDGGDLTRPREGGPEYPSRVYEGFGEAIMEAGQDQANPLLKRGFAIFTGIGRGHSHQDTLNIEIFAHGCRLAPDLGGRHEGTYRSSPNMRTNKMHNLVWVDNKEFANTFPGSTTSGTGRTESFSPQPGCQYTSNFARATSHRNVDLYQRSTAMIDGEVTGDKADMYIFDVFRVRGGKDHVYCFHGAYSQDVEANVPLAPAKEDEVSKWVLAGRMDKNPRETASADPLVMTWPLRPNMQQRYQGAGAPVGLALTLFGHGGDHVYVGDAASQAYPVDMPYLQLYSTGAEGRSSVYPAILEPYSGERFITEATALKVEPAANDAERGVALKVVTKQGRTDTLYSSLKPTEPRTVEGGVKVCGEFGFISEDANGLASAHLVGGTELTKGDISIRCDKPAYTVGIEKVDYDNRDLALSADLPAGILDKAVALIGNPEHQEAWNLESASGRKAKVQKRISYYQSVVETVDAKNGLVATEREPDVYGPDTAYTKGTRLGNENGSKVWKAVYAPQERWMYLGWPNTDLSYPRTVRMEDVPDADGDGKHTLKLMGGSNDMTRILEMGTGKEDEPKTKVILTLEVTRCDPDNFTFYFKMPEDPEYQNGGWQFANRKLVNEDGSKTWWATYPGTVNAWKLEDRAGLALDSFPDADGDGKRKVRAYLIGAGDTLSVKTFVHVMRNDDGGYEVRANAPCTVTLPGKAPVRITEKELADAVGVYRMK